MLQFLPGRDKYELKVHENPRLCIQESSIALTKPNQSIPFTEPRNPQLNPLLTKHLLPAPTPNSRDAHEYTSLSFPFPCHNIHLVLGLSLRSQVTLHRSSASKIYFPSLYFSLASKALSYFHPTVSLHCRQAISRTICLPVVMFRSLASPAVTLTTLLKR